MDIKVHIQEKAHDLFMRYGIRSVSMDDIALQLGMSKKTLYQYYLDKDELVDAVLDLEIGQGQHECRQVSEVARDAVHEIFIMMEQIMEQFRSMSPLVMHDLQKYHFKAYQKFLKYKHGVLLEFIRHNIERGIREELFRPEINADIISRFRIESMMLAFNVDLFPPRRYNLAEVTHAIIEHYLYGLSNLKGHKLIDKYHEQRIKQTADELKK